MKKNALIEVGLSLVFITFVIQGCRKKPAESDASYYQSPEGTFQTIQQLRLQLIQAVEKKNLQYVHDNMYYFRGLCSALAAKLQGDKKQRVDAVLAELTEIAEEIDNCAGRGNQGATEANLRKLIEELKRLEGEFPDPKKKK